MKENAEGVKMLYFTDLQGHELFNKHQKYVIIGELNRTEILKEFIAEDYEELFYAIEKYIGKSLLRRIDPLGYFLVGVNRIYELRPYKRMLGKIKPVEILC